MLTHSALPYSGMLAIENQITLPIPAVLVCNILAKNEGWTSQLQQHLESTSSSLIAVLNHFKRSKSASILPDSIKVMNISNKDKAAITMDLEFQEYQYRGHETFFYLNTYRQILLADVRPDLSALSYNVLKFPDALHDC